MPLVQGMGSIIGRVFVFICSLQQAAVASKNKYSSSSADWRMRRIFCYCHLQIRDHTIRRKAKSVIP
jgi:hypothetical protein